MSLVNNFGFSNLESYSSNNFPYYCFHTEVNIVTEKNNEISAVV